MSDETTNKVKGKDLSIEKRKEEVIEVRKKEILDKISNFFKSGYSELFYYVLLLIIIWVGLWIRTRNLPLVREALPADPDSALFLRYMKTIIEQGYLPAFDSMRYVPLGFNTFAETRLLPYFLAYLYKLIHIFNPTISITRVDMLYPLIVTPFIIIAFFLLVKKIFDWRVALVASAFLAAMPTFLQRTMLGFSDKEPLGTFLFFLSFYFIVSAWREKRLLYAIIYGLLSGVFTGLLGLTWGAVTFTFLIIGSTFLIFLMINNFKKRDFAIYLALILSAIPILFMSERFSFEGILRSPDFSLFLFPLIGFSIFYFLKYKLKNKLIFGLPHNISSLILSIAIALAGFTYARGVESLITLFKNIQNQLLHPFGTLRLTLTVAENQQPFITTWISSFGNLFWLMILGVIVLSYITFYKFDKKYRYILTSASTLFVLGLIFSRYRPNSIFNGVNTISQVTYFGGILILIITMIWIYLQTFYKKEEEFGTFKQVDKAFLFVIIWFAWLAIGARGAIRLLFLFSPAVAVFSAVFLVESADFFLRFKDKAIKIGGTILIILIVLSLFYNFAKVSAAQTKNSYPHLNPQWTSAMEWVKTNTKEDSVFAHWWDYGYWIQTAGERATVLDGGNVFPYWDYLMGRFVLTNPDDREALEFLYTHNVTHLLIDPTDISKYPAYSLIGSDENKDRYSWIQPFVVNERASQETRDGVIYLFQGGSLLDDNFIWKNEIFPARVAGIAGFLVPVKQVKEGVAFSKPTAIIIKNNQRFDVPLKCIFFNGELREFEEDGLDGCLYLIPRLTPDGKFKNFGSAFYLSPKTRRSLMVRLYLLNEDNPYFKLVHVEDNFVISDIKAKTGLNLPSIIDFNGLRAPIKIWKVEYPKDIKADPAYLETEFPRKELAE